MSPEDWIYNYYPGNNNLTPANRGIKIDRETYRRKDATTGQSFLSYLLFAIILNVL